MRSRSTHTPLPLALAALFLLSACSASTEAWAGPSMYAPNFTLYSVGEGPIDLIARRYQQPGSAEIPSAVILRRAQNFADGSVIPLLDFSSAEAVAPSRYRICRPPDSPRSGDSSPE